MKLQYDYNSPSNIALEKNGLFQNSDSKSQPPRHMYFTTSPIVYLFYMHLHVLMKFSSQLISKDV